MTRSGPHSVGHHKYPASRDGHHKKNGFSKLPSIARVAAVPLVFLHPLLGRIVTAVTANGSKISEALLVKIVLRTFMSLTPQPAHGAHHCRGVNHGSIGNVDIGGSFGSR